MNSLQGDNKMKGINTFHQNLEHSGGESISTIADDHPS